MSDHRKPWYRPRTILLVLPAIAVPVLAWAMWEVLHVYRAAPAPAVDSRQRLRLLFEDRADVAPDAAEESWAVLAGILDAAADAGQPGPEGVALLRERGVLDRLAAFADGPPGLRPLRGGGRLDAQIALADFGRARDLARFGVLEMRAAADGGDVAGAAEAFDETLAVARTIAWQPYLLGYLAGSGIEALALTELRYELMEAAFDEPACRALLASLERHRRFPPAAYALEAERIYFEDQIQWTYSDDGTGDGRLLEPRPSLLGAAASRFLLPSRAEVVADYDALMDGLVGQVPTAPADPRAHGSALPGRSLIVRQLAAPLTRVVQNDRARLARVEGTRVMVALALHRARHGAYPDAPDGLGAAGETVTAFAYRVTAGDPHGRPYLLTAPRPDGRGDLVLNEPRPE